MTTYEIIKNIEELGWFGRLEDFMVACEDMGLEVAEINSEYAVIVTEDYETEFIVYFGGTERTITIKEVVEA